MSRWAMIAATDEQWDAVSARFDEAVSAARAEADALLDETAGER